MSVLHWAFSWHHCFDGLFLTAISSNCGASLLQHFIKASPVAGLILDHRTKKWCVLLLFKWGSALKITLKWNSWRTTGNKPHEEPLKTWRKKAKQTTQGNGDKRVACWADQNLAYSFAHMVLIPSVPRTFHSILHILQWRGTSDVQQHHVHRAQHPQAKLSAHTAPCRCIQPETRKLIPMISSETSFQFSKKLGCQLSHLWQLSPSAALPPVHKPSLCSLLQSYHQFSQPDSGETVLAEGDIIIGNNSGPKNGTQAIVPLGLFIQQS